MKIFAISVLSLLVILAVAGCNPVGMDDTRVYVTGIIYTDSLETTGAEGIGIMTTSTQESYVTVTNANGVFWLEIQFYPEAGISGSSPSGIEGSVTFGLRAYDDASNVYYYGGSEEFAFTVFGGDTLNLYPINLQMFKASNSGSR
ncbi:hypothetical protein DRQ25_02345 [Candidatus Fermentibacteria bacterium]|nr:MAG: hypothetical protein DRQ25_02345 [Candidatus Fermentibacteria bacterium]